MFRLEGDDKNPGRLFQQLQQVCYFSTERVDSSVKKTRAATWWPVLPSGNDECGCVDRLWDAKA